jgi:hypothetical protein
MPLNFLLARVSLFKKCIFLVDMSYRFTEMGNALLIARIAAVNTFYAQNP